MGVVVLVVGSWGEGGKDDDVEEERTWEVNSASAALLADDDKVRAEESLWLLSLNDKCGCGCAEEDGSSRPEEADVDEGNECRAACDVSC